MKSKNIKYLVGLVLILIIGVVIFNMVKPKVEEYSSENEGDLDFILRNLVSGGPPKDGIPSIDNPKYTSANEAVLNDDSKIFGVDYNGFVAAYPQDILFWHEIVNQDVGDEKISITYCPLTESVIGYQGLNLGVSGELYNSNLVMYDRETDARIPQILGTAIEGNIKGKKVNNFRIFVTTWKDWKEQHTNTLVLSRDTGFNRDYNRSPYPGYDKIYRIWFPLVAESNLLKTKDFIFGIENNGKFTAILEKGFQERYPRGLNITLGGENIHVSYNEKLNVLEIDNLEIKAFETYWFAWYAYHPTTELIK